MEDASNAPKFHMDRSQYRDGLLQWFTHAHPNHSNIAVTDIDIPVATGFSNETVFFGVSSNSDEGPHEGKWLVYRKPTENQRSELRHKRTDKKSKLTGVMILKKFRNSCGHGILYAESETLNIWMKPTKIFKCFPNLSFFLNESVCKALLFFPAPMSRFQYHLLSLTRI